MSADVDENFARVTNLGEGELDTPDLSLVTETVLARKLQFKLEPSNHSTPKNGRESHVSSPSSKNFPLHSILSIVILKFPAVLA